jgi:Ca-activated chloride channel homolog
VADDRDSAGRWLVPLLFGENNRGEMTALAELTGGKVFDARTVPLADAFTEIRGYQ